MSWIGAARVARAHQHIAGGLNGARGIKGEDNEMAKYEFSIAELSKGDRIEPKVVARVIGTERHERTYNLDAERFAKWIARQWKKQRSEVVVTCMKGDAILVLDDAEASVYCVKSTRIGLRKFARYERTIKGLDSSRMETSERLEHAHNVNGIARLGTAIRSERGRIAAEADTQRMPSEVAATPESPLEAPKG
jgi:hypothetical protein